MSLAFIYTDAYLDDDYGPTHPLRTIRLKLTYDLIKADGLLDSPSVQLIPTLKAEEKNLAVIRSKEYRLPLKRLYGRRIFENQEEALNEISFSRSLEQVDSRIWRIHL
jgi:acetoin utilization deacetylase AcuC-like enzyme